MKPAATVPPIAAGPSFPIVDASPKVSTTGGRYRKPSPSVPIWAWIVGGFGVLVLFCCGGPIMFTAINPPAKRTPQQAEKSDWDRAWDSLPKRADGKWDWENTDRIDLETASSIDYAAGEEIRKVWQFNMKTKHKID